MSKVAASIPLGLIYSRLLLGVGLVALAWSHAPHYGAWASGLLVLAVLTDVLDGVVARQLGVSTQGLRRLDSSIDQVF